MAFRASLSCIKAENTDARAREQPGVSYFVIYIVLRVVLELRGVTIDSIMDALKWYNYVCHFYFSFCK